MANEFIARNGLIAQDNSIITGSLTVTGGVVSNLIGTASNATSASQAQNANTATSASYALNATNALTASYFVTSSVTSASYAQIATSASQATNSNTAISASFATNAATATTASYVLNAISSSYASNADLLDGIDSTRFATTGSNTFTGIQTIAGSQPELWFTSTAIRIAKSGNNLTTIVTSGDNVIYAGTSNRTIFERGDVQVGGGFYGNGNLSVSGTINSSGNITTLGTLTAQTLVVQTVTSSIVYSSGSNIFGNQLSNTQDFTGSVRITGSLAVNGNQLITGIATIGSSSLGASENTLTLGARDNGSEGGQLGLNAPGGTYTSASMIDNYANSFRVLTGTNASSNRMDLELSHVTQNLRIFGDVIAYAASDKRLKENIQPIENALDKLDKIGGYTFDWNDKVEIHGHKGHDIGVIAQEIEEVLPEAVTTRDNGYKAVKYEKLTAFLIQVNKEQQKIIKDQQRQIDELKELINIYIKTQ